MNNDYLKALNDVDNAIKEAYGGDTIYGPEDQLEEVEFMLNVVEELRKKHTTKNDEPFEIPVMRIFRSNSRRMDFSITGGKAEDWHYAIFANAAKDCKWVTINSVAQAYYFNNKPLYSKFETNWALTIPMRNDPIFITDIHPSLIPADCSRAIVRIDHV